MPQNDSSIYVGAAGIAGTVAFTVAGQILIKWRLDKLLLGTGDAGAATLVRVAVDPLIVMGFVSAGIAAFSWIVALSRLPLSVAYPFTGAGLVLVLVLSSLLFGETVSIGQYVGVMLVVSGLIVGATL